MEVKIAGRKIYRKSRLLTHKYEHWHMKYGKPQEWKLVLGSKRTIG